MPLIISSYAHNHATDVHALGRTDSKFKVKIACKSQKEPFLHPPFWRFAPHASGPQCVTFSMLSAYKHIAGVPAACITTSPCP